MRSAIKDYGDTNFITGMRAFAAFGVMLIHSGGAGLRSLGDIGNNLADLGRTGVYVFFVISGFSVAASFAASNGYLDYLGKRLWRVAPLYFFWIALASKNLWLPALQGEAQIRREDLYNILMHLSFLSFLDYKIANSILSVEWSISVEVFWYFVVPLLITGIQDVKTMFFSIIASLLLYRYAINHPQWLPVPASDASLALHWSPIPYVLSYCLGVSAYKLRPALIRPDRLANLVLALVLVLLAAFVIRPGMVNRSIFADEFVFISALTFALLLFGSQNSALFRVLFTNKPIVYLGTISFGAYLCHLSLIDIVAPYAGDMTQQFVLVAITATAVSTVTYYLIEKPALSLGRFLRSRSAPKSKIAHKATATLLQ